MPFMHFIDKSASRYPDTDSDSFLFQFTLFTIHFVYYSL